MGQAHFRTSAEELSDLADPTHSSLSAIFVIFDSQWLGEITGQDHLSGEKRRLQTISNSDVAATLQDSRAFVDVFDSFAQAVAILW